MNERKSISKKFRFEVFKRDAFTCQYCGSAAPDVVLQVDHIKPVAKGGDNDLTNLITSCRDCNSGKGVRELDDASAIAKQRAQLEDLNERRSQLEMLLEWREGLQGIEEDQVAAIVLAFENAVSGAQSVTEQGFASIRKWLKTYSVKEILDALDKSTNQYLVFDKDGRASDESSSKAFSYIPRIIAVSKRPEHESRLYYIRGILRNRLHYLNERECIRLLRAAHRAGATIDDMTDLARDVRNWTEWRAEMDSIIEGAGDD